MMNRKTFIRNAGLAAAVTLSSTKVLSVPGSDIVANTLPYWKGFNLTDFFSPKLNTGKLVTTEDHLKWMRDWGFNFVRIPIAYPCYVNFDRSRNITRDEVYNIDTKAVDTIDTLVNMAHKHSMHVSLNLHRAPGYCINAGDRKSVV